MRGNRDDSQAELASLLSVTTEERIYCDELVNQNWLRSIDRIFPGGFDFGRDFRLPDVEGEVVQAILA